MILSDPYLCTYNYIYNRNIMLILNFTQMRSYCRYLLLFVSVSFRALSYKYTGIPSFAYAYAWAETGPTATPLLTQCPELQCTQTSLHLCVFKMNALGSLFLCQEKCDLQFPQLGLSLNAHTHSAC